jgi:hypothetical protein
MYVKWKLISLRLELVLVPTQDKCLVCIEHTIGLEIIFGTLDDLLGDVGQVEAHFALFRDSVNISARWVHGFAFNVPRSWKSFLAHPMVLRGDVGQVEAPFALFGESQDRYMVCEKSTTGMEITLGYALVLLGNVCQVGACFSPFGDRCTVCAECTICFEIIFGAANGTPR